jgi:dTDP-4-dehydrorhamnose 3,5-epimerase
MNLIPTAHPDIIRVEPNIFQDDRGFFMETYQKELYFQVGISLEFVQDNHSSSVKNTLRGLHYQITHAQGKFVRAVVGEIFDVAVDLRRGSPLFGTWVGAILSADNKEQIWIPPGFAHGFYTLSERADVIYKTTDYYDPQGDRCIRWDDPDLAIKWPISKGEQPLLSKKDAAGCSFLEAEVYT